MNTKFSLPWLPEEEALLLKLWHIHGTNYERIRIEMEKEGWIRTEKAIKHHCPASVRKAKTPVSIPIGPQDPMQILAICKPWGKPNVSKQRATKVSRKSVRSGKA